MSLLSQNVMKIKMYKVVQHRSVSQSPLYPIMTHKIKSVKTLKSNFFQKTQLNELIATANSVTCIPPPMSISTNVVSIVRKNDMATPHLLMVTPYQGIRQFSTSNAKKQLVPSKKKSDVSVPTGEKVAQAGKDVFYTSIMIGGAIVTGLMFYAIGRELFSGDSPNVVYSRALKKCRKNDDVEVVLGLPLKGRGEMNRRGRSRHVSHTEFERDGVAHMRMKFYVSGPHKEGTVHLEVAKNDRNKYEVRYMFIDVDDFPRRTIVIEDNR